MNSDISLTFGIDDRYVEPAAVTIMSLTRIQPTPIPITVVHSGLEPRSMAFLGRISESKNWPIAFQRVDPLPAGPVSEHVSNATYLRLFAPQTIEGVSSVCMSSKQK
jgi:lipopolysaccharide biosynthesis glycosyltransferase